MSQCLQYSFFSGRSGVGERDLDVQGSSILVMGTLNCHNDQHWPPQLGSGFCAVSLGLRAGCVGGRAGSEALRDQGACLAVFSG